MQMGEFTQDDTEADRGAGASDGAFRRKALRIASAVAVSAALACAPAPPAQPELPDTPARMAGIVSALEVALPHAQDQDDFAAASARTEIRAALRELRRNASALELHGGDETPGFRFFSRRLAEDAAEIGERFESGSVDESRFLLNELVNDCAGCHVRLPDPREHGIGVPLTERLAAVRPETRARLLVATRQFDAALDTYETLLAAKDRAASALDFEGDIEDALVIAVRVRSDFSRADAALATLAARGDAPSYLMDLVATWRQALADLRPYENGSTLVEAREVLERGAALRRYPADRSALVHDLVASALLHRALARGLGSPDETAEASFLLGLAELRNDPTRGLPQAEFYLESAVRSAPGSPYAREAYALLEEQTVLGWSGSGGAEMPSDVKAWLRELRTLAGIPQPDGDPRP